MGTCGVLQKFADPNSLRLAAFQLSLSHAPTIFYLDAQQDCLQATLGNRMRQDLKLWRMDLIFMAFPALSSALLRVRRIGGRSDFCGNIGDDRGGSVCLNSLQGFAKWIARRFMLLPGLASAR